MLNSGMDVNIWNRSGRSSQKMQFSGNVLETQAGDHGKRGGLMTVTEPRPSTGRDDGNVPALRVTGLTVDFPGRGGVVHAVRGVDLSVRRGETLALLGESGSGKSMTARAVMRLVPPSAQVGAEVIEVDGADVLHASPAELRRLRGEKMAMVFQDPLSALNPVLSVGSQVGELFRLHRGMGRRKARVEAERLLAAVGIPDPGSRVRAFPHQCSGGMRQRILIALAIALRPGLLIADEPTTALDVTVQAQILDLLRSLQREMDLAILLITHDLGVVCEVADHVAVMYAGRVVEAGPAEQVLSRPAHPYTRALLDSVPQAHSGSELPVIGGSPPPADQILPGCSFAPRCRFAVDRCRTVPPVPETVTPGRMAACHRAQEVLCGQ
jgi:oligopeptide transport system ATP-binding protein